MTTKSVTNSNWGEKPYIVTKLKMCKKKKTETMRRKKALQYSGKD